MGGGMNWSNSGNWNYWQPTPEKTPDDFQNEVIPDAETGQSAITAPPPTSPESGGGALTELPTGGSGGLWSGGLGGFDWGNWINNIVNRPPPKGPSDFMDEVTPSNHTPVTQLPTSPASNFAPVQRITSPFDINKAVGVKIDAKNRGKSPLADALRARAGSKSADSGGGGEG